MGQMVDRIDVGPTPERRLFEWRVLGSECLVGPEAIEASFDMKAFGVWWMKSTSDDCSLDISDTPSSQSNVTFFFRFSAPPTYAGHG